MCRSAVFPFIKEKLFNNNSITGVCKVQARGLNSPTPKYNNIFERNLGQRDLRKHAVQKTHFHIHLFQWQYSKTATDSVTVEYNDRDYAVVGAAFQGHLEDQRKR